MRALIVAVLCVGLGILVHGFFAKESWEMVGGVSVIAIAAILADVFRAK